jgi:hypothetical protein
MTASAASDVLVTLILAISTAGVGAAANVAAKSGKLGKAAKLLKKITETIKRTGNRHQVPKKDLGGGAGTTARTGSGARKGGIPEVESPKKKPDETKLREYDTPDKSGGPKTTSEPKEFKTRTNSEGLTTRAEGRITGPHPKRKKGYRPEPVGGRAEGHHRGHLVPENMVDDPKIVNVKENIISEAPGSNLGPKRVFENKAGKIAKENPNSVVETVHFPKYKNGKTVPHAVTHYIKVDGKIVHGVSIPNK